jgi:hypothetical protein
MATLRGPPRTPSPTGKLRFLRSYAEVNAILLPGRIPGYKRDDLQLLPSSTTKKVSMVKPVLKKPKEKVLFESVGARSSPETCGWGGVSAGELMLAYSP